MIPRPGIPGAHDNAYNFLESTLRAISDIQILLALALALSVVLFGICRTLQYHFEIGINLLLVACANYLQTLSLTRHYWRSWPTRMAALLRLLIMVGIYFCFGWILAIQNHQPFLNQHHFAVERMTADNKRDSAILLKAACFLEPSFQNNTFAHLNTAERTHIGLQENTGGAAEWILGLTLGCVTLLIFMFRILGAINHSLEDRIKKMKIHTILCASIWIFSLVVFCYSATTVSNLRSWVSKSGWLQPEEKNNPDDNIRGFGQTAALVLIGAMLINTLDNVSIIIKQTVHKKKASAKRSAKGKGKPPPLPY